MMAAEKVGNAAMVAIALEKSTRTLKVAVFGAGRGSSANGSRVVHDGWLPMRSRPLQSVPTVRPAVQGSEDSVRPKKRSFSSSGADKACTKYVRAVSYTHLTLPTKA